jgi:hypothetical protein
MDKKKTLNNIAVILICLLGLSLIGYNIYQHQQIKRVSQGATPEKSSDNKAAALKAQDKTPPVLKSVNQSPSPDSFKGITGNSEVDDLNYQLDAAEEELALAKKQLADEEARKAEKKKLQSELQKKYREDPAFKKSMRESLDMQYADLFKKLNLSPEKLEKFKDMLVDEVMAQQDIWTSMASEGDSSTLSKEQQAELQQRYEAIEKEYDKKKSEFLGQSDYDKYQEYTQTSGERYYVNNFIQSLGSEEKLTDAQKEELIDAMYDEIKNVTFDKLNDDSESSSNMYDDKNIARMLKNQDRQSEAYLKAARERLSASQIEKFKAYFKQQRDQYESYMRMAALRNGAKTTEDTSDGDSK